MKKILLLLTLSALSTGIFANTYYNKASGVGALQTLSNWGTATDGTGTAPGGFTTSGDVFNLYNGTTGTISGAWVITGVTLNVGNGAAMDLTIPSTFSLTGTGTVAVSAGATLTLQNTTNPTLGTLNATSTVDYNGTGAQTIAVATYGNLSLSGARTGTPAITLGSGTVNVAGNFSVTYTGAVTFTTTGNTFVYNTLTGGSTIGGITYNIFKQSNTSGTNTAGGNITIGGTLTTTAGGTLDMGAASTLSVTGTITNAGTIKTSVPTSVSAVPITSGKTIAGTVIYGAATGSQTVVSGTYTNITMSNSSGTNTAGGNVTLKGALTTTAGGTLDFTAAYRLIKSGGAFSITNNGTIQTSVPTSVSASPLISGATWNGTGTVLYAAAAGAQTVMKGTYNCNLTLANISGTNIASGVITFNGTLTITSAGILNMSTFALAGTGTPTNNGTITTSSVTNPALPSGQNWTGTTGNMIFAKAAGGQFIPAGTYGTLKFSNTSGTVTATGAITVNTSMITTSGGTLALAANQLLGAFTPTNNGTITTTCTVNPAIPAGQSWSGTTGAVTFAATTGAQFIPSGTFQALTFSNTSGTNTAVGNITVNTGTMTTTAGGTLDMGTSNILSGTGTFTNNGIIKTSVPAATSSTPIPSGLTWAGTITYGAATGAQTVVAGTYTNLTCSNTSGTNTAGGNIVVNTGTMTTTAGGTLDMGTANILSGTGTFTNNGIIQTSVPTTTSATPIPSGKAWAGTITYGASAGAQTIVSETSYNNVTLNNTSGTNTSAANLVVNGTLATAGGVEDMAANTLSGTLATISGSGTIETANTSATPITANKTWTQNITYYTPAGGQSIVGGTYNGGLTNSNTSGSNTVVAASTVSISGNLTLNTGSSLNDNGVTIALVGNIAGAGTHTGTGAIKMTSSGGTISGATLGNLTLNNAGGFSLSGNLTIKGTLTFTSGQLNIGTNNLIFGSAAPAVTGTLSSSNMIVANGGGQVQKQFASTGSFLFPVGDNSPVYSPITLNFTGGTFTGGAYAGINVTKAKHPQNANSANYLNRYWSIATSGITSPVYQVTAASYVLADVTGTEGSMVLGAYSSLPWIKVTGSSVNTVTHTLAATGTLTNTAVDITGISSSSSTVSVSSPTSATICSGGSEEMDATPTGDPSFTYAWTPSTGLSATTGATVIASPTATGTVTSVYTYTVTMSDGNGFLSTATHSITVNPVPVISGTTSVCLSSTTTLSSNIAGTWSSSNSAVASVGSSSGIVNGVAIGTATITITPATTCTATATASVNAVPAAITGSNSVCAGSVTTLAESVSGGNWSSSDITIATVDASGNVTGVGAGSGTISYISGASCFVTQAMTVGPLLPITGTLNACVGLTSTLSDASTGGTWTSGNTSVATIGSGSGIVTGVGAGTVGITYTLVSGCSRNVTVTINAVPAAITGTASVCAGLTTTLNESVSGGTWSSNATGTATVGTGGIVTGVAAGNATISYVSGPGCSVTVVATVNPLPASITGTTSVCAGLTTTLNDATGSGSWTSSNANATVGSSTGAVAGVTAGTATITYTLPTGCINTAPVTINALPAAITGTMNVCVGLTTTLNDVTSSGSWSSGNTSLATIGSSTGIVSGVAAGNPTITYTLTATGCINSTIITVNPLPGSITGTSSVCVGLTTTLSDAGGGTWSSSNGNATIGSSTGTVAGVTAGTSTITYTLPTGCINTSTETVNPLPLGITGTAVVCVGLTTTLNDATASGSWSSSNTGLATVGSGTGVVTGVASGNPTITYTLPTGCIATTAGTVNPVPAAITGTTTLCNGATATLSDVTGGGTWSSSDVTNATIGSSTGFVTTVSSGPATITYLLPTGCTATTLVNVNDVPSPISGTTEICNGQTTTLSDPDAGGTWSSSDGTIATIGSASGLLTSVAAGSATVGYTFTATGCSTVAGITIDPQPLGITGNLIVCVGSTTDLDNSTTGGDWTSSNTAVGTIDVVTGIVTALTTGTTTATYTMPTGCTVSSVVTVTAMPTLASATNNGAICVGGTLTLTANTPANVTAYAWAGPVSITASTTAAASVSAATLAAAGVYTVTVTNGTGVGCTNNYTTTVVVNATPTAGPTNSGPICNSGTVTLTANPAGSTTNYTWSGSNLSSTTVANPTATPSATATYSLTVTNGTANSGCSSSYTSAVTVSAKPTAGPTNSGPICNSGTVTLTANPAGSTTNYTWSGSNLSSTTVANPTATPTATATYSLTVTNGTANSGCSSSYTSAVTVSAKPTAGPTNSGPICNSGTVTLTANPAGSTTNYTWSGSNLSSTTVANPTATPTATATYSLTVTNGTANSGCSSSYTSAVTVSATPTAGPTNSGPICNSGTVTLTANPAGSTTNYTWSGSNLSSTTVANPTATPTATATYSLTVTNGTANSGCSSSYTSAVTVSATPTAGPTNSGPICNSGTVTLTANPAGSTTNYTWSGSNLSSTTVANPTATPTATATYSLTVTNGTANSGCSSSYTSSVTVSATPTAGPTNSGPICNSGTVTLTANPAGSTTNYTWSGSNLSSTTVANPTATPTGTATYSLTVTNGTANSGCSSSYTSAVTVSATPTAGPTNSGPICNSGTVTLTANPAGSTTNYTWSGSNLSSTTVANPTATPTATATYSLTVTNGTANSGCSSSYTSAVTVSATPTAGPTNSGPICNSGTVTLTANPAGSTTNYTWSGSNLSSTTVANPTATPTATATYSLTVTNGTANSGCSSSYTSAVTVSATPTAGPTNSGPICNSGTVTLTANPAGSTTNYTWSGSNLSSTTVANPTATPTATATYSLTVTNGTANSGCSSSYTSAVTVSATPTAGPTNSGPICNSGTVTLTANPAGSTTNYTWSGSNLSSTTVANPTATPTATATYSLTVTNGTANSGCSSSYTSAVTVSATPTAGPTNSGPICNSGTVTLTANPAGSTTNYTWSGSNLSSTTVANPTATPTATATYSLTVTNGTANSGCSSSYTSAVTVSATPTAGPTNSGPICNSGTVTLTANPAGSTTNYTWSGSNLSSTTVANPTATPTATATYSLTVTNGTANSGCSSSYTSAVTVSATPTAGPTNSGPICNSGTVTLTANPAGSTTNYTWSGSNLSSTTVANPTATPTATATYSLTVTNGTANSGCSSSYTSAVTVSATPTAGPTNSGPICNSGTVTLTANPAGSTTNYTWSGSNLSSTTVANPTATPTATATYSLTVTNGTANSGCSSSYTSAVTVSATPTAGPTNSGPICNSGTVALTANPAGSTTNYTWSGSNLSSTTVANPTATPTATATYSLTVTNGTANSGCSSSYTSAVTVSATPTAGPTNSGPICNSGTVTLTANPAGSTTNYTWSGSNLSSTTVANPTATPTATATYSLTVTNGTANSGCSSSYTSAVTVSATPTAGPTNSGPICNSGTVALTANPAGSTTNYTWSGSNLSSTTVANPTATPTATATYSLTVTNGTANSGCSSSYTSAVTVSAAPTAGPTNSGPICNSGTVTLTANPAGSTTNYTWSGSNLSSTTVANPTATPTATATYSLTVTNGTANSGCSSSYTSAVTVSATPTAGPTNSGPICNSGTVALTANPAGSTTNYTWSGSNLSSTTVANPTATPTATATYSLTVTNGTANSGCSSSYTSAVTVSAAPTAGPTNSGPICNSGTVTLTANPAGSTTNYTWSGSNLSSTTVANPTATPTATATYSLTVTNGTANSGCSSSYTSTVAVSATPTAAPTSGPICIGSTATLLANPSGGTTTYSWSGPNLSSSTVQNPTATPTVTSTYSLTVTDGSGNPGCSPATTYTTSVTVNSLPSITSTSNNGPVCSGGTFNLFSAESGGSGSYNYAWSGPNSFAATVQNPSISAVTTAATGTYTLSVTDGNGCSSGSATTSVTINAAPSPSITTISNSSPVCSGATLSLTSAASGGTGTLSYLWAGPNSFSSTLQSPSIGTATTAATGVYTLTVTDVNACIGTGANTTTATVNPTPNAGTITGGAGVCVSSTLTLSSSGDPGGVWSSSSPVAAVGSSSGIVSGVAVGNSNITYSVTNAYSCNSKTTQAFNVQIITENIFTYGGTGTAGYTGDGTLAISAKINTPRGLTSDAAGNVYFCDVPSNVVRKISNTGIITTFAGTGVAGNTGDGGQATAATLNAANGIFVDAAGNVLICNTASSTVRKVNTSGIISTIAGTGVAGYNGDGIAANTAKLNYPLGVCEDASGNVYIADQDNYRIRRIDAGTGIISTIIGYGSNAYDGDGGPGTAARISYSRDVQADNNGNLYIADCGNDVIRKYNIASKVITTFAGKGGMVGNSGDGGPATAAVFNTIARLAFDGGYQLYVADQSNQKVRVINLQTGIVTNAVGTASAGFSGDLGPALSSQINQPSGVALDHLGNLYVADALNHRIRIAALTGSLVATLTGPSSVPTGTPITMNAVSSITANVTYQWQVNNSNISGATSTSYTDASPVNGNVYACIANVTPECGSPFYDTSNSIAITVYGPPPFMTSSVKTATAGGEVSLYPNPAGGLVTITASNLEDGQFRLVIYDQLGKQVLSKETIVAGGQLKDQLDIQALPGGLYIVELTNNAGAIARLKLVKD